MAKIFTNDIANAVRSLIGENIDNVLYTKGDGENAIDVTGGDVLAWFEAKAAQAEKRNAKAAERSKAKRNAANADLMEKITTLLKDAEEPMSGKALAEAIGDVTSHKIAAVVRNMDNIKSEKVKGVNAYSLA